jgi:hypothetical protein
MKKKVYALILFFTCLRLFAVGQTDCNNLIDDATDMYQSGRYDECIRLLEAGLKTCPLSKNKKEKAYILLINANIERDSIPAVDKGFKLLLLNNPAFKLKDYDGIDDFKSNFNNYYVFPKLAFGFRIHYRMPKISRDTSQFYSVMPNAEQPVKYKTTGRFNVGFMMDYRVNKAWAQFAEISYYAIGYDFETKNSYWTLNAHEDLSYVQWDIGTKYYFNSYKKFNPYILGGMSNQFLLQSHLTLNTEVTKVKPDSIYNAGINMDVKDNIKLKSSHLRNPYVPYILLGTGIMYKTGNMGYGLDFRFYTPLKNLNNSGNRFKEHTLIEKYGYIDNDFRMNRMDISFVVVYMFNKVKSIKQKKQLTAAKEL